MLSKLGLLKIGLSTNLLNSRAKCIT